jgi:hypothetical protein
MMAETATVPFWQWEQLQLQYWVDWLQSLPLAAVILAVAAGIIVLLYGRTLFRAIVVINAAILAGYLGWQVGLPMNRPWLFSLGFAVIFGILAWPLFKLGVAVLFGLVGAALGMQAAAVSPYAETYGFIFAIVGFVVFAVLGWLVLLFAVTVFTAVEGSIMIVLSLLELMRRGGMRVREIPWLAPDRVGAVHIIILVLALLGILYQFGVAARVQKSVPAPQEKAP